MIEYTVEFRIFNSKGKLDIKAINDSLGLVATNTRQKGDPKGTKRRYTESLWGYDVFPKSEVRKWATLENAFKKTYKIFYPRKNVIKEYSSKYHVAIWCACFTPDSCADIVLSPTVLKLMGKLGVEIFYSTYCNSR